jgi:LPXTG-site transpeptidase (sortase) family protein
MASSSTRRISGLIRLGLSGVILFAVQFTGQGGIPARAAPGPGITATSSLAYRPLFAPVPSVSVAAGDARLGSGFSFTVTFSNSGDATGYGPFIDLYFPVKGIDGPISAPDDGITFLGATYLNSPLNPSNITTLTFDASGTVTHPYLRNPDGSYMTVTDGTPGDQLVIIQLPFGSFTPSQPAVVVTVNAHLSDLADLDTPLEIRARAGFRYGTDPLDNFCCGDPPLLSPVSAAVSGWPATLITPTLIDLAKTYNGPENETASGPNYLRQYTVSADIAENQTVTNLVLTDTLPDNLQFSNLVLPTTPSGATCTTPSTTPGGTVECTFSSVTGGPGTADASFTFEFYIPLNDASSNPVIDAGTGAAVQSDNNIRASGDWQPKDTRDLLYSFTVNDTGPEHTLNDRSVAIQKDVAIETNVGPAGYSPGDTLQYTLAFQVSDFFAFQNVIVSDVISDGQHFDPSYTPRLTVNGNNYLLAVGGFDSANYTVAQNYTGAIASPPIFILDPNPNDGTSTISFRVSNEIATRGENSRLVGGCIPPGGLNSTFPVTVLNCDPGNGGYNDGSTAGTITFQTVIQDQFTDTYPSGDPSVDHGDVITDNVTASGDLLTVANTSVPTGSTASDTSASTRRIAFGALTKSVYAVNGDTGYDLANGVATGDNITFRFIYTLPTSDFETLVLTDFFPLPIFDVSDPDANGSPGPGWALDDVVSIASPAPGHVKFGLTDSFRALAGNSVGCSGGAPVGSPPANADGTPCVSADPANNSLKINYGNFDDPTNTDTQVDLLFTLTVTDKPFTDGLFLTNQAHTDEGTTNSTPQLLNNILDFKITAPYLISDKSAVSSDNPAATLSAPTPRTFNPPGTGGVPWSGGTIYSDLLSTTPLDSDISGVDAGDLVRFAIVVENQGSGLYGAFDVTVHDSLPAGYIIPAGGLHLKVTRGDETDVSFTYLGGGGSGAEDDLFYNGIRLDDSGSIGSCEHYNPTNGRNIAIITYDLQVDNNVNPEQQIVNTGGVTSYSGKEGGTDYTGLGSLDDTATTTIGSPALDKALTSTEINNGTTNNATQAVIGELATYTLTLTLPEGAIPDATLVDTLDSRMSFVDVLSVTMSSGVAASNTIDLTDPANPTHVTIGGASANQLTFDFGAITNLNDNTTPDTITVVLRAVVLNVALNQGGATLTNTSLFNWTVGGVGHTVNQQAPTTAVSVIEPAVTVQKQACDDAVEPCTVISSLDAGDLLFYRIQLTGNVTDSYDLTFSDPLPSVMTGLSIVSVTGANPADFQIVAGTVQTTGSADIDLAPGATIVIYVQGTVSYAVIPGQSIANTATAHWTSLNGNVTGRSTHDLADSGERTGADGVGGALNDYAAANTATVNVLNVAPVKSIVSTSESHTSESGDGSAGNPRNLAIGEIIRYRLSVLLPEGSSPAFTITDTLPAGFNYIPNTPTVKTTNVIFLTDDHNTAEPADLGGADTGSLPPTFPVPDSRVALAGQDVIFTLGDLVNNDNDPNAEYVVIDFNVLVNNDANNDNTDLDNNSFTVRINGSPAGSSNTISTRIVEPIILFNGTANNKTVNAVANRDAGDTATYTVTYQNTGLADAFEVRVLDTLPAVYLDLTTVNAPSYSGCGSPTATDNSNLATDIVDLTIDRVQVGCRVTFTYVVTLRTAVTPNQTITNTAAITYTSLPGTGTPGNPTGSDTPGGSGAANGERNGSGGVNDYTGSDTAQFTTRTVARAKTVVDTEVNVAGNNNTQATIGEIVTYQLVITVPEGTTPILQVVDTLDANMAVTDVCVSGYPAAAAPISISPGLTTSLPGGFANACNDGTNAGTDNPVISAAGGTNGRVITWSLGTITDSDTNNGVAETITIYYQAVMLNVTANQAAAPTNRSNSAIVSWTGNTLGAVTTTVDVVEATVNTSKGVSSGPYDAGDTVAYTVTLTNPAAGSTTAFDTTLDDPLSAYFSNASVAAVSGGGFTTSDFSVSGCPGACRLQTAAAAGIDIPANTIVTITLNATLAASVPAGQIVGNTTTTQWTSMNGPVGDRSTYNNNSEERDGSGGLLNGGELNDYRTQGAVSLTVATPTIEKQAPTPALYAIGATVTYPIKITLPEGITRSLRVIDQVPSGMVYVSSSVDASGFAGVVNASPSLSPVSPVEGDDVTFTFGDTTTTDDNNGTNNSFFLNVTLRVLNVAANQIGVTLTNGAALRYVNPNTSLDAPDVPGGTKDITVIEPVITFGKTIVALPSPLDAGGVVQYEISYTNGTGANVSTAYDVDITDSLPAELSLNPLAPGDIHLAGGAAGVTDNSSGNNLDVVIASIPPGGSVVIDYTATLQDAVAPGDVVANTSNATWTSLGGSVTGERTGAGGVDDYFATSGQSFSATLPGAIEKQLMATSAAHTPGDFVTIGEIVTYGIKLTFPEGTTPADSVVDDLQSGLALVDGSPQVITTAVASSGLLTEDFNGSLGTPSITPVSGDGGSVQFDFTNVEVAGDNNPNNNTILLKFQVRITDVPGNVGYPLASATVLSNEATNTVGAVSTTSNSVDATVVEPYPVLTKSFANQTHPAMGDSGWVGDVMRMTLTYQNTGTSNAYDVVISDALDADRFTSLIEHTTPSGFTYSTSGTNPVTIQYAADAGLAVAPGATLTFDLDFTLTSNNAPGDVIPDTADVTQTTTLDSSTSDGDDANERNTTTSASADLFFNGVELSITKNDGGVTAAPGNPVTYTLNYANSGNIDATNVLLTETVPAHTVYHSGDNTTAWDCGMVDAPAGTACTFAHGTLASGAAASDTFVVTVDDPFPASVDQISNTVTIQADQPETHYADNTASDTTPVLAGPALTITKDDGIEIAAPGALLTYAIRVTNSGNQDLVDLALVDTVPPGTSFDSASAGGSFDGTSQITWPSFDLAAGSHADFTVGLRVDSSADLTSAGITSAANFIHIQDDGTNTTGNPVEAQATDTDQIALASGKLRTGTEQSDSTDPQVLIGEIVDYSITMNIPAGTIDHLQAVDTLDSGLAFVDVTSIQVFNPDSDGAGTADDGIYSSLMTFDGSGLCTNCTAGTISGSNPLVENEGGKLTFDFGQLINDDPVQVITIEYQVIVLDVASNVNGTSGLNNQVTWTWEGGTLSAQAEAVDVIEPKLTIAKTVTPQIAVLGSTVTFNILVGHDQLNSTAPAYDVLVTDAIPTGLVLDETSVEIIESPATPFGYSITATPTQLSIYWQEFPLASTATITFQARFIGPSPVVNTTSVEWSSIQIDPRQHLLPFSAYNIHSTERRYDPLIGGGVNNYRTSAAATLSQPALPQTGFAPGEFTPLPQQPSESRYHALVDLWLEIPALGVQVPIIGVPTSSTGWDLTWLWDQAGYLEGTAYPTWTGNSVLTGHVYLSDGSPGPFVNLKALYWGQKVIVHMGGQKYIYQVQDVRRVWPDDNTVLVHQDVPTLTLITCQDYDQAKQSYRYRIAVRAVLVVVEPDTDGASRSPGGSGNRRDE